MVQARSGQCVCVLYKYVTGTYNWTACERIKMRQIISIYSRLFKDALALVLNFNQIKILSFLNNYIFG